MWQIIDKENREAAAQMDPLIPGKNACNGIGFTTLKPLRTFGSLSQSIPASTGSAAAEHSPISRSTTRCTPGSTGS